MQSSQSIPTNSVPRMSDEPIKTALMQTQAEIHGDGRVDRDTKDGIKPKTFHQTRLLDPPEDTPLEVRLNRIRFDASQDPIGYWSQCDAGQGGE